MRDLAQRWASGPEPDKPASDRQAVEPRPDALAALEMAGVPEPEPSAAPVAGAKGRGATVNPAVRFDAQSGAPFDDGWEHARRPNSPSCRRCRPR